ncbi:hypothetical protein J8273_8111 [Carpediemonas membranifera]|uniref:Uncharacterized protein n=1 Tax=Carpediemonas membranifera TaxID=201153 RepID=A0A8J6B045_9EUKA|nr:hypothetical protein J8273_8111 [Carpediemonas membranifera]|eukprot:KAG9390074.1 hypothetical protein J8273_8111 [Carpediemonas membranifera]
MPSKSGPSMKDQVIDAVVAQTFFGKAVTLPAIKNHVMEARGDDADQFKRVLHVFKKALADLVEEELLEKETAQRYAITVEGREYRKERDAKPTKPAKKATTKKAVKRSNKKKAPVVKTRSGRVSKPAEMFTF